MSCNKLKGSLIRIGALTGRFFPTTALQIAYRAGVGPGGLDREGAGAVHEGDGDCRRCSASQLLQHPLHCPLDLHNGAS
jgi:hypothetical protein